MGMGDHIALAGACVILAEKYGGLIIPTQPKYITSLRFLFSSHPEIEIISLPLEQTWRDEDIIMAQEETTPADVDRDHFAWLYHKLDIDYQCRWLRWPKMPRVQQVPFPLAAHYAFVHDDASRRFVIDPKYLDYLPPVRPWAPAKYPNIFAYCDMIEYASQVHVIDSCFFHLTEQLNPIGKLYFHRYPRLQSSPWTDYQTRHRWLAI